MKKALIVLFWIGFGFSLGFAYGKFPTGQYISFFLLSSVVIGMFWSLITNKGM